MNAVERLWRDLADRDWKRAEAQLHGHAVIEMPASGRRFDDREAYILHHAASSPDRVVSVRTVIHEGKRVAVHVTITTHGDVFHGAGFYELHEGRIAHGVELWADAPENRGRS
jgi:hypothetical protein